MIRLFNELPIEKYFQIVISNLRKDIYKLPEHQITAGNLEKIVQLIKTKNKIQPIILSMEGRTSKVTMEPRPGSSFPGEYDVDRSKSYSCAVVNYIIPFTGNSELFSVQPTRMTNWSYLADISKGCLTFKVWTLHLNEDLNDTVLEMVKKEAKVVIGNLEKFTSAILMDIENFENTIEGLALDFLKERKNEIEKRNKRDDDLNNL